VTTGVSAVTVFCGSSRGRDPRHAADAATLGADLARRGVHLVYGGASVGTMGVLADAALAAGGRVTGVIPRHFMGREVAHTGLTELVVVESMHERKALMADLADAFMALPGGLGTLDELAEIVTWSLLGLHHKPVGLLNAAGFYERLLAHVDHVTEEGFLRAADRARLWSFDDVGALADAVLGAIDLSDRGGGPGTAR